MYQIANSKIIGPLQISLHTLWDADDDRDIKSLVSEQCVSEVSLKEIPQQKTELRKKHRRQVNYKWKSSKDGRWEAQDFPSPGVLAGMIAFYVRKSWCLWQCLGETVISNFRATLSFLQPINNLACFSDFKGKNGKLS